MGANTTKEIIKKYGIKLTKSLGQNFLKDESVVEDIIESASVTKEDLVLEIGPGIGSMTTMLAESAGKVVAVEIDKHLMKALQANLSEYSNVLVVNQDIMKTDVEKLISENMVGEEGVALKNVKVVANLPYYITTPIIMKLLEENPGINTMVFMVQKEVAERMVASPGTKTYGALSVAVQFYSDANIMFTVPPHCFIPQPEVDSSIIRLDILSEPKNEVFDKKIFFRVVKAAFEQRRKKLLNAIVNTGNFNISKDDLGKMLVDMGLDENVRGEVLSIMQFTQLSNLIYKKIN